ncbi:MAG: RDD family protein [Chitinophagaceae bacterium]|nr:RDD family protein [Chitinophagaceae bacterium]MCW5905704.1 RDD family protein [Chitinophagaceae bacterium]
MMKLKYVGTGTRVLNFIIDTIIIFIIAYIAFKIHQWYVFYYKINFWNFGWFFFGTIFFYYAIVESIFAKTPGKWLSQSKVVNQQGFKPSFFAIIIRSLVRVTIIDMFFIPFLNKPLHDYLSKTEVVES